MKTYIIVTALGLCLAIPGYAQKTKPPQKGKQPSAAERSKAAAQRAGAQKRAAQKRAIQKAAAQKPGGKAPAAGGRPPRGKAPAPAAGGRPPAGKGPVAGPRPGGPDAGRPNRDGPPPKIFVALEKLYGRDAKPNKAVPIGDVFAALKRLDANKDGNLTPEELFHGKQD